MVITPIPPKLALPVTMHGLPGVKEDGCDKSWHKVLW